MSRILSNLASVLGIAAAGLLATPAAAQCFGPNNLSGPCWQQVDLNVPTFPQAGLEGLAICWDSCQPSQQSCVRIDWTPPLQGPCGQFKSTISVIDCATGALLLTGGAVLDLTRTWEEVTPPTPVGPGEPYQVWRFTAKVDFSGTAILPAACPVPSCLSVHPTAFYYGYVDYAQNCITGAFENATVLHHQCDHFIHQPGISDRPGVFHPGTSFSLVAPSTAANPFIPMILPPPGGPLVAEAVRNVPAPAIIGCITEEPLQVGNLQPFVTGCACPFTGTSPQHSANHFDGVGVCVDPLGLGSNWIALNFFPMAPWVELVKTSIGCWSTDTGGYPGKECAWVDEGLLRYHDSCAATGGTVSDTFEIFYGATTTEGWKVVPPVGGTATQNFLDVANNFQVGIGLPIAFPVLGSIRPTEHLIYVNFP